jgi:hypothetical protein
MSVGPPFVLNSTNAEQMSKKVHTDILGESNRAYRPSETLTCVQKADF